LNIHFIAVAESCLHKVYMAITGTCVRHIHVLFLGGILCLRQACFFTDDVLEHALGNVWTICVVIVAKMLFVDSWMICVVVCQASW
jgi:hypothetical protein